MHNEADRRSLGGRGRRFHTATTLCSRSEGRRLSASLATPHLLHAHPTTVGRTPPPSGSPCAGLRAPGGVSAARQLPHCWLPTTQDFHAPGGSAVGPAAPSPGGRVSLSLTVTIPVTWHSSREGFQLSHCLARSRLEASCRSGPMSCGQGLTCSYRSKGNSFQEG